MKKSVKQPTGLVKSSKSIARSLAFVGSVVSVGAVAVSAVGGLFAYKLYRTLSAAQKALPKMERAAELYIAQSAREGENASPRRNP